MGRTTGEGQAAPEGEHVFVSYARPDAKAAQSLIRILEDRGFTVWWDGLIPGGERFGSQISEALENARAVVVLWSASASVSHWVQDEAGRGRDRHCLVPLSLDGTEPPLGFRQFQCIDISKGRLTERNPAVQRALQCVAEVAGRPLQAPPRRTKAPVVSRRVVIGAGGAAVAAAGGLAAWTWIIAPQGAEANSIAVLPFQNLSGDSKQQYLSDGLAAELRSRLARNPLLSVVGQASSNAFRERAETGRAIAGKLGVASLLDGNVRTVGETIRIAVELIDGKSGFSKWSRSFERGMDNLLQLQVDVADAVSAALSARLSEKTEARARSGGTANVAAFDAYLRGKELFDSQADEGSDRAALARFGEAVRLDPTYAAARAARSRALAVIGNQYAQADERRRVYAAAVAEARQAIRSAPQFADGHAALGYAQFYGRLDIAAADAPYRQAGEFGQGSPDVLSLVALYRARRRQFAPAISAIERAQTLDPLNPGLFKTAGRIRFAAGDYPKAIAAARRALEINPSIGGAHGDIANALLLLGRLDEASAEFAKERIGLLAIPGKAMVAIRRGDQAGALRAFEELRREEGDNGLYQQAQVLAQWGRLRQALDALDQALEVSDSGLVYLLSDPFLKPLHGDPRFNSLLRKLHFV